VLSVTTESEPERGPGEVLVDAAAAGVNFADLVERRGRYPGGPQPPYAPEIEVAGRVADAGLEVDFAADTAVACNVGGFGNCAVVSVLESSE